MIKSKFTKLYSKEELGNDDLFIDLKDAVPYFKFLKLRDPDARLRLYLQQGLLVGRVRNVSATGNPRSNKYEVFKPDIGRFKDDIYKGGGE